MKYQHQKKTTVFLTWPIPWIPHLTIPRIKQNMAPWPEFFGLHGLVWGSPTVRSTPLVCSTVIVQNISPFGGILVSMWFWLCPPMLFCYLQENLLYKHKINGPVTWIFQFAWSGLGIPDGPEHPARL